MILGKQSIAGLALALFVATTLPAQAGAALLHGKKKQNDDLSTTRKPTPAQNALIDKAIAREKVVIKTIKERAPLVETYIQNMKPDPLLGQVPESDQHFLSRVDFKSVPTSTSSAASTLRMSSMTRPTRSTRRPRRGAATARWDSSSIPSPLSAASAAACTSPSTRPASSRCC